jgi:hypothetical protein
MRPMKVQPWAVVIQKESSVHTRIIGSICRWHGTASVLVCMNSLQNLIRFGSISNELIGKCDLAGSFKPRIVAATIAAILLKTIAVFRIVVCLYL